MSKEEEEISKSTRIVHIGEKEVHVANVPDYVTDEELIKYVTKKLILGVFTESGVAS